MTALIQDVSMLDFLMEDLSDDLLSTKTNEKTHNVDQYFNGLTEQGLSTNTLTSLTDQKFLDFVSTDDLNSPFDDILLQNEPSAPTDSDSSLSSSPPVVSIPSDIDFDYVFSDPSETEGSPDTNVSSPVGSEDSGVCSEVIETVPVVELEAEPQQPAASKPQQPTTSKAPEVIQLNIDTAKNLLKKVYTVASAQPVVLPLSAIKGVKTIRVINSSPVSGQQSSSKPVTVVSTATTTTAPTTAALSTTSSQKKEPASKNVEYPSIDLTGEEERLLRKEGLSLPSHYPLTRDEERDLKRIRRKIRNKISAQDSRKRKKEYLDGLEDRVKNSDNENQALQQRVKQLENANQSLMSQLRRLQQVVTNANNAAHTSTTMLVLLLSFCLILLPNLRPGAKDNNKLSQAQQFLTNSVPGRTLLSTALMGEMSQTCDPSEMPIKEEPEEMKEQVAAVVSSSFDTKDFPLMKEEVEEEGKRFGDHDYSHRPAKVPRIENWKEDNYTTSWVNHHNNDAMDIDWGIAEDKPNNDVVVDGIWDTVPLAEPDEKNKSLHILQTHNSYAK